ncbi:MAG: hypothetical protein WBC70_04045 [Candidatus Aminicenantales bacterium]
MVRKLLLSLWLLCFLSGCGNPRADIKRIQQDGVEVVLNPKALLHPVLITLTRVFSLSTGRDDLAAAGLTDFDMGFDVDSQGFIYTGCLKSEKGPIFKFDPQGNLVHTFSHVGQGPGEIQGDATLDVSAADEVVVTNTGSRKVLFFSGEGKLIREQRIKTDTVRAIPIPGGGFVAWSRILDAESEFLAKHPLQVTGPDLKALQEIDRQQVPNPLKGEDFLGTFHIFSWSVSPGRIYSAFQDRGYDIWVHDFKGNLVRKIRKEFESVPVGENFKASYLKLFEAPLFDGFRKKIHFPPSMPPLDSILSDEEGRLFVLTYEVDPTSGANLFDVFDAEGSLEGRMMVKVFHDDRGCAVRARRGRLYAVAENEVGDKELVVYEMSEKI